MLGIDHLLSNKGPLVLLLRHIHSDAVLKAQHEIMGSNDVAISEVAKKLAKVAIISSSKSVKRAQLRSYLAA
jgi:hypothetical protein